MPVRCNNGLGAIDLIATSIPLLASNNLWRSCNSSNTDQFDHRGTRTIVRCRYDTSSEQHQPPVAKLQLLRRWHGQPPRQPHFCTVPLRHQLWATPARYREAATLEALAWPATAAAAYLSGAAATPALGSFDYASRSCNSSDARISHHTPRRQPPFSLPPNDLFTCGQPRQRCPSGATTG